MVDRKAAVVGRMPVLRGHDEVIPRLKAIDQRHDLVASGHRQGAAGTEVVLNVNDDQGGHGRHYFLKLRSISSSDRPLVSGTQNQTTASSTTQKAA